MCAEGWTLLCYTTGGIPPFSPALGQVIGLSGNWELAPSHSILHYFLGITSPSLSAFLSLLLSLVLLYLHLHGQAPGLERTSLRRKLKAFLSLPCHQGLFNNYHNKVNSRPQLRGPLRPPSLPGLMNWTHQAGQLPRRFAVCPCSGSGMD